VLRLLSCIESGILAPENGLSFTFLVRVVLDAPQTVQVCFMRLQRPHDILVGGVGTINHLKEWEKLLDILVVLRLDFVLQVVQTFELHAKFSFSYPDTKLVESELPVAKLDKNVLVCLTDYLHQVIHLKDLFGLEGTVVGVMHPHTHLLFDFWVPQQLMKVAVQYISNLIAHQCIDSFL